MSSNLDCRPENFNELPEEKKKLYANGEDVKNKRFMVVSDFFMMEDVAVQTTHKTIASLIRKAKNEEDPTKLLDQYFKRMVIYTQLKDQFFEEQGKAWQRLCDDLVTFYCIRAVVLKMPIPIKEY
jgi:hypothetical protein